MKLARLFAAALVVIAGPLNLTAQAPAQVVKGQLVAFRVPLAALKVDGSKYTANIARVGSSVSVNDHTEWTRLGFAVAKPFKIGDIKSDSKSGKVLIRLNGNSPSQADIYLEVAAEDTALAFGRIFFAAAEGNVVRAASISAVGEWLFPDTMQLGQAARDSLLAIGKSRQPWDTVTDELKDRRYLRVRAPEPTYTYNNNQTSVAERQAGSINEVAFPILRQLGSVAPTYPASLGFLVVVEMKSKDMAGQYSWLNPTSRDELSLYVPATVAGEFARTEITNQELIDQSVVLYKGSRIKIDLTK